MLSLPLASLDTNVLINICINGLVYGFLYALIALGYTMVYGIVELINFAHGDLFMLGSMVVWSMVAVLAAGVAPGSMAAILLILAMLVVVPLCCALLNAGVDVVIYRPLRNAPKLAPLVSAIGVSFVFMNIGQVWGGSQDVNIATLIPDSNILGANSSIFLSGTDVLVIAVTVPVMILLTFFVKFTSLGRAMRATAQNPVAAQLMGIQVNRVISVTFLIGGALAGVASVIYALKVHTVNFQMGFQNGLYAFTAVVLGGIGNIPGAVVGSLIVGMVYSLASGYADNLWATAMVFLIMIVILVFRPQGIMGARVREKV
ncbi:MAG: branched-chain amino acid ABC transporter permease [Planctomycetes bacterium]|nr:branched-chain amino acid ABC transporter permease [Planctomycetota bacterium]